MQKHIGRKKSSKEGAPASSSSSASMQAESCAQRLILKPGYTIINERTKMRPAAPGKGAAEYGKADRKTDYNQSCLPLMQKGFIIKVQKNSTFKIIARYFYDFSH
jgi:hypothetical protein